MCPADIIVVDDEPSGAAYMSLALRQARHTVRVAHTARDALVAIEQAPPNVVITDLQMPEMGGMQLLSAIKSRWPSVAVIVMTVEQAVPTVVEAIRRGADNYLVKPVSIAALQAATSRALATGIVRSVLPPPSATTVPEIVGGSPPMTRVRQLVELAAKSSANVLIYGETGTGKELVARALHRLAGSDKRPFLAHNCARTAPELFDSEFFGHRRGAFTGADANRLGVLREADGGSLFLDELECLNPVNQAKLLRVLDDGEFRPVGSEESRSVRVRFLAATNRKPEALMDEGALREDLYFRICGFQIDLPALRDRPEDIDCLARHFLGAAAGRLTSRASEALEIYDWPGNVRQLRSVLRTALTKSDGGPLEPEHLDLAPRGRSVSLPTPSPFSKPPGSAPIPKDPEESTCRLSDRESQAIREALTLHQWNLGRAAKALGIHRSTLRRKIAALVIRR